MRGNNCSRCIYVDSPCVPSDYGRDKHNNCDHYKSVFEENKDIYKKMTDLDTALEDCTESLTDARIKIKELEKENEELKDKLNNLSKVAEVRLANWQKYEKENAELKEQLEICETNADTYYDELTKLQEQLVKTTQIGMTCSNCKWSQYDEDEMCYCCSDKDKWELKLRR